DEMSKKEEKAKRIAKREKMLVFARKIAKQTIQKYPKPGDRMEIFFLVKNIMNVELFVRE
ncbi:unnamed protein product, partial [marine sediment metagenome]